MIIKSHIRGGYRAAADYLKDIGANEKTRLVAISDPDAKTLDEAFHNMWTVACNTKCKKPLHHISINPFKGERLTDAQVLKIIERAEQKYGYKPGEHQRVIVEHIKDGRQHFHVMWNRVSLKTGKAVWPGEHWKKSKQVAREMEKELGLKRPTPKRFKRMFTQNIYAGVMAYRRTGRYWKTGSRFNKSGKGYKTGGRHYRNNGSRYNHPRKSYVTKSTWRMSKVGKCGASYPSSPAYGASFPSGETHQPYAKQYGNMGAFSAPPKTGYFATCGAATSFIRILANNPRYQHAAAVQTQAVRFLAGGNSHHWHFLRPTSDAVGTPEFYMKTPHSAPTAGAGNVWIQPNTKHDEQAQKEAYAPPFRPEAISAMPLEQLIDLQAARDGKITWAEYFKKWGRGGSGLKL